MNFKRKKPRRTNKYVSCSFCVPSIGLDKEQKRIAKEQVEEALSQIHLIEDGLDYLEDLLHAYLEPRPYNV
jgi:hypothetical protein